MTSASPATVFLGICAILFGLASAYGVRVAMTQEEEVQVPAPPPPARPQVPTRNIIVAATNLPPYCMIKSEHLQTYTIPEERFQQLEGAISRPEKLIGRVTSRIVQAGNALSEADVYELGKVPTLEDKLKAGETAMTIPVDVETSIAGYLHPDAYVNVSLTVSGNKHPELKDMTTVTLLKNVRVLATSANLFSYNPGVAKNMSNITIAVSPEVANKMIVARKYGNLSVTLAKAEDAADGLQDNGPEFQVAPLDLFGLEEAVALVDDLPVAKSDMWYSTNKRTLKFDSDEVKEAKAATEAAGYEEGSILKSEDDEMLSTTAMKPHKQSMLLSPTM